MSDRRWRAPLRGFRVVVIALTLAVGSVVACVGPAAAASGPVTGSFVSTDPVRVLDTRAGQGPLGAGHSVTVRVLGRGAVPSSGVSAVEVRITVTGQMAAGNVVAFPAGGAVPAVSNVNFVPYHDVSNTAMVPVGVAGAITLVNRSGGPSSVILDVLGAVIDRGTPIPAQSGSGLYVPVNPRRILDTRTGLGGLHRLAAGQTVRVPVTGLPDLFNSRNRWWGTLAVNVTATAAAQAGNLQVGDSVPGQLASNVNFAAGQDAADMVIVPEFASNSFTITNHSRGSTDVVVDLQGYFEADVSPAHSPGALSSTAQLREIDTRTKACGSHWLQPGASVLVSEYPTCSTVANDPWPVARSSPIIAMAVTITAVDPSESGNLAAGPHSLAGASGPSTSVVNFAPGQTVAGFAIVKSGNALNGDEPLVVTNNSNGSVDVLVDVAGVVLGPNT